MILKIILLLKLKYFHIDVKRVLKIELLLTSDRLFIALLPRDSVQWVRTMLQWRVILDTG